MMGGFAQVAALELEGQRMQLEQQDAADQQISPEALQRLQQQVLTPHALYTAQKQRLLMPFSKSCSKACQ